MAPLSPAGVDVRIFGAKCDGTTDDSAAFQAAGRQMAAQGGTILVPAGTCVLAEKLTLSFGTSLAGQGMSASRIVSRSTKAIEFVGGDPSSASGVRDLTLLASTRVADDDQGFGIKFTALRALRQAISVRDVRIASSDGNGRSFGWSNAIWVNDILSGAIRDTVIDGSFNAQAPQGPDAGPRPNGITSTGTSTGLLVDGLQANALYRGLYFTGGKNEGPKIVNSDLVAVYYGIDASGWNRKPGFWLRSNHINAVRYGVVIDSVVDLSITQLWIFRSASFSAQDEWTGLYVRNAPARTTINQVSVNLSRLDGTSYGIRLENCAGVVVSDSAISQANHAVFHAGTNRNIVYRGIVLNGLGTGVGFTLSPTDRDITITDQSFQGSVGTRYDMTPDASIHVDTPSPTR